MALKILAVDDEPAVLSLLKGIIEPLGCELRLVSDSREAARLIEQEKFDGVIVDVKMPHLDGYELTRRIRLSLLNRAVPIVVLTGSADVDAMRNAFNAGASFFLGKPFTREHINALFGATHGAMLKEKRKNIRLPLRTTVTCHWGGHRQGQFKAGSVDICMDGMLLGPSGGLDVNQEVEMEFELPTVKKPVKTRARVIRRDKSDQIAVLFMGLSTKDEDAIRSYINARVRN
jgi:CheY-like chemotaxis protein